MSRSPAPGSIVVGVDGSNAAINAAKWAVAEAISRNIPLRLIHAIGEGSAGGGDAAPKLEHADTALRAATAALQADGRSVTIDAAVVPRRPAHALIDESLDAAMVCVGSIGIGRVSRKILGSTAESVAQQAYCPVAVIRDNPETPPPTPPWIAVVVDDSAGNDAVLEHGFREARLRGAQILALGVWRWGFGEIPYQQLIRRLGSWVSRYPEIHVQPAAARHGVIEFLSGTEEPIQLAVVGSHDAEGVARMIGPVIHHLPHRPGHSVLVVQNPGAGH